MHADVGVVPLPDIDTLPALSYLDCHETRVETAPSTG
jgi:hypothetical protein